MADLTQLFPGIQQPEPIIPHTTQRSDLSPTPIPGYAPVPQPAFTWITVAKTVTESRTSNTTPANDAELFFPVKANSRYTIRAFLFFGGNDSGGSATAGGYKYTFSVPSVTYIRNNWYNAHGNSVWRYQCDDGSDSTHVPADNNNSANTREAIYIHWLYTVGSTAGIVYLQWSQNNSSATPMKLWAGAYIDYMEIT